MGEELLVHLLVPLFGAAFWAKPFTPLFLASLGGAGVALTFVGEPSPPSDLALPWNVQHVHETWTGHVARLERVAGHSFEDAPRSLNASELASRRWSANLNGISGYKPVMRLLYPELVRADAAWTGWCDCDVLLGAGLPAIVARADADGADLITPLDDAERDATSTERKFSWGPLTLLRSSAFDATVAPALLTYLRRDASPSPRFGFDEWGFRRWGGAGYANSFSGVLAPLVKRGQLTAWHPPGTDANAPPLFDGCCKKSRGHLQHCKHLRGGVLDPKTCGYCRMRRDETGATHLEGLRNESYFMCHFQYAKVEWGPEATRADATNLALLPAVVAPASGSWFVPY